MSDRDALRRRADELDARAAAASRHYDRTTWIRFTVVFFPVPLILVALRLHVDAWAYYVAGALIALSAASMFALDGIARNKRDAAIRAAEDARRACDQV